MLREVTTLPSDAAIYLFPHGVATNLEFGSGDEWPTFDRVMATAAEALPSTTLPPLIDPAADHVAPEMTLRRAEVDGNHRRLLSFLRSRQYEAALLSRADSIAWFTAGADVSRDLVSEKASVALFVSEATRAILADNVQSARVFEEELAGLGFQLKEHPWHHEPDRLIAELIRNKRVASDTQTAGLGSEAEGLKALRLPMTSLERSKLRDLGRSLTQALEATCRAIVPGETEADVAGQLAHRLLREGIVPVDLRVAGDGRMARYRRPIFKSAEVRRQATISVTGRRLGLCASASRTVSFGRVAAEVAEGHTLASMVFATCVYFSRPGEIVSEVYRRSRRIFEKFGHPHEWTLDYQGEIIGYSPRELLLLPESRMRLPDGAAFRWGPSVGEGRSDDTAIIESQGFEIVTASSDWPKIEVSVKGFPIDRPAILER